MIVKITYDDQRMDVFDTNTYTCPSPLGKQNMLTNFEVRFDDMGSDGLWLAAHSYRIDDAQAREAEEAEVPSRGGRRAGGSCSLQQKSLSMLSSSS